jgi:hypothetical protein
MTKATIWTPEALCLSTAPWHHSSHPVLLRAALHALLLHTTVICYGYKAQVRLPTGLNTHHPATLARLLPAAGQCPAWAQ